MKPRFFLIPFTLIAPTAIFGCRKNPPSHPADGAPAMNAAIDPNAAPLPAEKFAAVSEKMTLGEILALLGPARRDIGSGIYILEWESTDGRAFIVGTTKPDDLKSRPMYAHWKK
jgi:hypothetical protein